VEGQGWEREEFECSVNLRVFRPERNDANYLGLQLPPLSLLRFSAQGQNGQHKSIVNVQHHIERHQVNR
jgi:hypothetical protein